MICSHDSLTYQSPKNPLMILFQRFWKCQDKSLNEQYWSDVQYFDIRLYWTGKEWGTCHGITEFDMTFRSLELMLRYLRMNYPDVKLRICLDKGDSYQFQKEFESIKLEDYPQVDNVIMFKNNWLGIRTKSETLVPAKLKHVECCFNISRIINENFKWYNAKDIWNLLKNYSIKKFAKTIQQKPTKEMVDDQEIVYFMDFVE